MDYPFVTLAVLVAIYATGCGACYAVGRWHERQRRHTPTPPLVTDTMPPLAEFSSISERSQWIGAYLSRTRRTPLLTRCWRTLYTFFNCYKQLREEPQSHWVAIRSATWITRVMWKVHK